MSLWLEEDDAGEEDVPSDDESEEADNVFSVDESEEVDSSDIIESDDSSDSDDSEDGSNDNTNAEPGMAHSAVDDTAIPGQDPSCAEGQVAGLEPDSFVQFDPTQESTLKLFRDVHSAASTAGPSDEHRKLLRIAETVTGELCSHTPLLRTALGATAIRASESMQCSAVWSEMVLEHAQKASAKVSAAQNIQSLLDMSSANLQPGDEVEFLDSDDNWIAAYFVSSKNNKFVVTTDRPGADHGTSKQVAKQARRKNQSANRSVPAQRLRLRAVSENRIVDSRTLLDRSEKFARTFPLSLSLSLCLSLLQTVGGGSDNSAVRGALLAVFQLLQSTSTAALFSLTAESLTAVESLGKFLAELRVDPSDVEFFDIVVGLLLMLSAKGGSFEQLYAVTELLTSAVQDATFRNISSLTHTSQALVAFCELLIAALAPTDKDEWDICFLRLGVSTETLSPDSTKISELSASFENMIQVTKMLLDASAKLTSVHQERTLLAKLLQFSADFDTLTECSCAASAKDITDMVTRISSLVAAVCASRSHFVVVRSRSSAPSTKDRTSATEPAPVFEDALGHDITFSQSHTNCITRTRSVSWGTQISTRITQSVSIHVEILRNESDHFYIGLINCAQPIPSGCIPASDCVTDLSLGQAWFLRGNGTYRAQSESGGQQERSSSIRPRTGCELNITVHVDYAMGSARFTIVDATGRSDDTLEGNIEELGELRLAACFGAEEQFVMFDAQLIDDPTAAVSALPGSPLIEHVEQRLATASLSSIIHAVKQTIDSAWMAAAAGLDALKHIITCGKVPQDAASSVIELSQFIVDKCAVVTPSPPTSDAVVDAPDFRETIISFHVTCSTILFSARDKYAFVMKNFALAQSGDMTDLQLTIFGIFLSMVDEVHVKEFFELPAHDLASFAEKLLLVTRDSVGASVDQPTDKLASIRGHASMILHRMSVVWCMDFRTSFDLDHENALSNVLRCKFLSLVFSSAIGDLDCQSCLSRSAVLGSALPNMLAIVAHALASLKSNCSQQTMMTTLMEHIPVLLKKLQLAVGSSAERKSRPESHSADKTLLKRLLQLTSVVASLVVQCYLLSVRVTVTEWTLRSEFESEILCQEDEDKYSLYPSTVAKHIDSDREDVHFFAGALLLASEKVGALANSTPWEGHDGFTVGQRVRVQDRVYECIKSHAAQIFDAADVSTQSTQYWQPLAEPKDPLGVSKSQSSNCLRWLSRQALLRVANQLSGSEYSVAPVRVAVQLAIFAVIVKHLGLTQLFCAWTTSWDTEGSLPDSRRMFGEIWQLSSTLSLDMDRTFLEKAQKLVQVSSLLLNIKQTFSTSNSDEESCSEDEGDDDDDVAPPPLLRQTTEESWNRFVSSSAFRNLKSMLRLSEWRPPARIASRSAPTKKAIANVPRNGDKRKTRANEILAVIKQLCNEDMDAKIVFEARSQKRRRALSRAKGMVFFSNLMRDATEIMSRISHVDSEAEKGIDHSESFTLLQEHVMLIVSVFARSLRAMNDPSFIVQQGGETDYVLSKMADPGAPKHPIYKLPAADECNIVGFIPRKIRSFFHVTKITKVTKNQKEKTTWQQLVSGNWIITQQGKSKHVTRLPDDSNVACGSVLLRNCTHAPRHPKCPVNKVSCLQYLNGSRIRNEIVLVSLRAVFVRLRELLQLLDRAPLRFALHELRTSCIAAATMDLCSSEEFNEFAASELFPTICSINCERSQPADDTSVDHQPSVDLPITKLVPRTQSSTVQVFDEPSPQATSHSVKHKDVLDAVQFSGEFARITSGGWIRMRDMQASEHYFSIAASKLTMFGVFIPNGLGVPTEEFIELVRPELEGIRDPLPLDISRIRESPSDPRSVLIFTSPQLAVCHAMARVVERFSGFVLPVITAKDIRKSTSKRFKSASATSLAEIQDVFCLNAFNSSIKLSEARRKSSASIAKTLLSRLCSEMNVGDAASGGENNVHIRDTLSLDWSTSMAVKVRPRQLTTPLTSQVAWPCRGVLKVGFFVKPTFSDASRTGEPSSLIEIVSATTRQSILNVKVSCTATEEAVVHVFTDAQPDAVVTNSLPRTPWSFIQLVVSVVDNAANHVSARGNICNFELTTCEASQKDLAQHSSETKPAMSAAGRRYSHLCAHVATIHDCPHVDSFVGPFMCTTEPRLATKVCTPPNVVLDDAVLCKSLNPHVDNIDRFFSAAAIGCRIIAHPNYFDIDIAQLNRLVNAAHAVAFGPTFWYEAPASRVYAIQILRNAALHRAKLCATSPSLTVALTKSFQSALLHLAQRPVLLCVGTELLGSRGSNDGWIAARHSAVGGALTGFVRCVVQHFDAPEIMTIVKKIVNDARLALTTNSSELCATNVPPLLTIFEHVAQRHVVQSVGELCSTAVGTSVQPTTILQCAEGNHVVVYQHSTRSVKMIPAHVISWDHKASTNLVPQWLRESLSAICDVALALVPATHSSSREASDNAISLARLQCQCVAFLRDLGLPPASKPPLEHIPTIVRWLKKNHANGLHWARSVPDGTVEIDVAGAVPETDHTSGGLPLLFPCTVTLSVISQVREPARRELCGSVTITFKKADGTVTEIVVDARSNERIAIPTSDGFIRLSHRCPDTAVAELKPGDWSLLFHSGQTYSFRESLADAKVCATNRPCAPFGRFQCTVENGVAFRNTPKFDDYATDAAGPNIGDVILASEPVLWNVGGTHWIATNVGNERKFLPLAPPPSVGDQQRVQRGFFVELSESAKQISSQQSSSPPRCPRQQSHVMTRSTTTDPPYQDGWQCDWCEFVHKAGTERWCCVECSSDICFDCVRTGQHDSMSQKRSPSGDQHPQTFGWSPLKSDRVEVFVSPLYSKMPLTRCRDPPSPFKCCISSPLCDSNEKSHAQRENDKKKEKISSWSNTLHGGDFFACDSCVLTCMVRRYVTILRGPLFRLYDRVSVRGWKCCGGGPMCTKKSLDSTSSQSRWVSVEDEDSTADMCDECTLYFSTGAVGRFQTTVAAYLLDDNIQSAVLGSMLYRRTVEQFTAFRAPRHSLYSLWRFWNTPKAMTNASLKFVSGRGAFGIVIPHLLTTRTWQFAVKVFERGNGIRIGWMDPAAQFRIVDHHFLLPPWIKPENAAGTPLKPLQSGDAVHCVVDLDQGTFAFRYRVESTSGEIIYHVPNLHNLTVPLWPVVLCEHGSFEFVVNDDTLLGPIREVSVGGTENSARIQARIAASASSDGLVGCSSEPETLDRLCDTILPQSLIDPSKKYSPVVDDSHTCERLCSKDDVHDYAQGVIHAVSMIVKSSPSRAQTLVEVFHSFAIGHAHAILMSILCDDGPQAQSFQQALFGEESISGRDIFSLYISLSARDRTRTRDTFTKFLRSSTEAARCFLQHGLEFVEEFTRRSPSPIKESPLFLPCHFKPRTLSGWSAALVLADVMELLASFIARLPKACERIAQGFCRFLHAPKGTMVPLYDTIGTFFNALSDNGIRQPRCAYLARCILLEAAAVSKRKIPSESQSSRSDALSLRERALLRCSLCACGYVDSDCHEVTRCLGDVEAYVDTFIPKHEMDRPRSEVLIQKTANLEDIGFGLDTHLTVFGLKPPSGRDRSTHRSRDATGYCDGLRNGHRLVSVNGLASCSSRASLQTLYSSLPDTFVAELSSDADRPVRFWTGNHSKAVVAILDAYLNRPLPVSALPISKPHVWIAESQPATSREWQIQITSIDSSEATLSHLWCGMVEESKFTVEDASPIVQHIGGFKFSLSQSNCSVKGVSIGGTCTTDVPNVSRLAQGDVITFSAVACPAQLFSFKLSLNDVFIGETKVPFPSDRCQPIVLAQPPNGIRFTVRSRGSFEYSGNVSQDAAACQLLKVDRANSWMQQSCCSFAELRRGSLRLEQSFAFSKAAAIETPGDASRHHPVFARVLRKRLLPFQEVVSAPVSEPIRTWNAECVSVEVKAGRTPAEFFLSTLNSPAIRVAFARPGAEQRQQFTVNWAPSLSFDRGAGIKFSNGTAVRATNSGPDFFTVVGESKFGTGDHVKISVRVHKTQSHMYVGLAHPPTISSLGEVPRGKLSWLARHSGVITHSREDIREGQFRIRDNTLITIEFNATVVPWTIQFTVGSEVIEAIPVVPDQLGTQLHVVGTLDDRDDKLEIVDITSCNAGETPEGGAAVFPCGTPVVRGPGWNTSLNDDGGPGNIGYVVRSCPPLPPSITGFVEVWWRGSNSAETVRHLHHDRFEPTTIQSEVFPQKWRFVAPGLEVNVFRAPGTDSCEKCTLPPFVTVFDVAIIGEDSIPLSIAQAMSKSTMTKQRTEFLATISHFHDPTDTKPQLRFQAFVRRLSYSAAAYGSSAIGSFTVLKENGEVAVSFRSGQLSFIFLAAAARILAVGKYLYVLGTPTSCVVHSFHGAVGIGKESRVSINVNGCRFATGTVKSIIGSGEGAMAEVAMDWHLTQGCKARIHTLVSNLVLLHNVELQSACFQFETPASALEAYRSMLDSSYTLKSCSYDDVVEEIAVNNEVWLKIGQNRWVQSNSAGTVTMLPTSERLPQVRPIWLGAAACDEGFVVRRAALDTKEFHSRVSTLLAQAAALSNIGIAQPSDSVDVSLYEFPHVLPLAWAVAMKVQNPYQRGPNGSFTNLVDAILAEVGYQRNPDIPCPHRSPTPHHYDDITSFVQKLDVTGSSKLPTVCLRRVYHKEMFIHAPEIAEVRSNLLAVAAQRWWSDEVETLMMVQCLEKVCREAKVSTSKLTTQPDKIIKRMSQNPRSCFSNEFQRLHDIFVKQNEANELDASAQQQLAVFVEYLVALNRDAPALWSLYSSSRSGDPSWHGPSINNVERIVSNMRHLFFSASSRAIRSKLLGSFPKPPSQSQPRVILRRQLSAEVASTQEDPEQAFVERLKRSSLGQLFDQLTAVGDGVFFRTGHIWKVKMSGFNSIDAGGPFRESIAMLCDDLQGEALSVFVPTPNQRHNTGTRRGSFLPNPSLKTETAAQLFCFVGKLMGMAIRSRELLPLSLAPLFWARLGGAPVTANTLAQSHHAHVSAMTMFAGVHVDEDNPETVVTAQGDEVCAVEDFEDMFCKDFTYVGIDGTKHDLVPDGATRNVLVEDASLFAKLAIMKSIEEIDWAVDRVREGLGHVVPLSMLRFLRWDALETRVCGSPKIDLNLLKSVCQYEGLDKNDQTARFFWEVMESMSDADQAQVIRFAWARSRLPRTESSFSDKFKLRAMAGGDNVFPVAHTCYFQLDLPAYSSVTIMRERLLYAIWNTVSIDGDGTTAALETSSSSIFG